MTYKPMGLFLSGFIVASMLFIACQRPAPLKQPEAGNPLVTAIGKSIPGIFTPAFFTAHHRFPAPRYFMYGEKFITMGNAQVRYLETGMSQQPPIVLLHGAQLRAESWKQLGTMRYLAERGFRVISLDLPRHGKTGNPTIAKENYLFEFLQSAHIQKPIIMGQSYAGSYVLPFLTKYSQMISGVILLAPTNIKDYLEPLKRVAVPALILWGDADDMISVQQAYLLQKALSNSTLKIFEGAPHECYQTSAPQFHDAIGQFVTGLASR